jgi:ABC-2 type transport system permease protein
MKKFWRIFVYEYLRHVLRKRFLFALLSLPLMVLAMAAVGVVIALAQYDARPVGYVDLSGWLKDAKIPPASTSLDVFRDQTLLRYENETAAGQALSGGQIQAYYLIQPDYLQTGSVRQVAIKAPSETADSVIRKFLTYNLVSGQSPEVARRILNGDNLQTHALDSSREMNSSQWYQIVIPILAGVLFVMVINISGGYLLQALVEEKENRTMEIVITSVSPSQLMGGKIAGNLSVGLTQLLLWLLFPAIAFLVVARFINLGQEINFSPQYLALTVLTLIPAFVLVAALMATVGATATEAREAQQIAGLFTLPIVVPYWFVTPIITHPNSPLAIGMSLFPLTAPVSLPLRAAFTTVPFWQAALSIGMLFAAAAGAIWLAGRAFRLGMLRYGKRLSWRELVGWQGLGRK